MKNISIEISKNVKFKEVNRKHLQKFTRITVIILLNVNLFENLTNFLFMFKFKLNYLKYDLLFIIFSLYLFFIFFGFLLKLKSLGDFICLKPHENCNLNCNFFVCKFKMLLLVQLVVLFMFLQCHCFNDSFCTRSS